MSAKNNTSLNYYGLGHLIRKAEANNHKRRTTRRWLSRLMMIQSQKMKA
jgi:hypothetical protein